MTKEIYAVCLKSLINKEEFLSDESGYLDTLGQIADKCHSTGLSGHLDYGETDVQYHFRKKREAERFKRAVSRLGFIEKRCSDVMRFPLVSSKS